MLQMIAKEAVSLDHCFHVMTLSNILADSQSNILGFMAEPALREMWRMLLELQRARDVKAHFLNLEEIGQAQAHNPRWFEGESGKLLVMKLLVMAVGISDLARTYDYASTFKAQVLDHLFDDLDLTRCYGMIYQDETRTRDRLDRDASTVALVTYVCIPLLNRAAEVFPVLGLSTEQLRQNLKKWVRGSAG
jgi:hypothetical protein